MVGINKKGSKANTQKQTFVADFKLDVVKPGSKRVVWIHKDE